MYKVTVAKSAHQKGYLVLLWNPQGVVTSSSIISFNISVVQYKQKRLHTPYLVYMLAVASQVLFLFFMCIALGKYANDGVDKTGLKVFGKLWKSIICGS